MLWSLIGYVRISLSGTRIIELMNHCRQNGILLKNIKRSSDEFIVDVKGSELKTISKKAKEYNVAVSIQARRGVKMKLLIYKSRRAFALSLFLAALLFVLNTGFVRKISVDGNRCYTDGQIIAALQECGFYQGICKYDLDVSKVKDDFLKKFNTLSWIWIDIKGTTAYVSVREKVNKPDFFNSEFTCNVVASRDGVITQCVAESGMPVVKAGEYVTKGQLLIGGVYDANAYAPVRFVHASGTVYAKTVYCLEGDFKNTGIRYRTGAERKSVGIRAFGIEIGTKIPQNSITRQQTEKKIKIFGKKYLPLAFTNQEYCEIIKEEWKLNKNQTIEYAIDELSTRLKLIIPEEAAIINTSKDIQEKDRDTVHVKLTFDCVENIASELPITVENNNLEG